MISIYEDNGKYISNHTDNIIIDDNGDNGTITFDNITTSFTSDSCNDFHRLQCSNKYNIEPTHVFLHRKLELFDRHPILGKEVILIKRYNIDDAKKIMDVSGETLFHFLPEKYADDMKDKLKDFIDNVDKCIEGLMNGRVIALLIWDNDGRLQDVFVGILQCSMPKKIDPITDTTDEHLHFLMNHYASFYIKKDKLRDMPMHLCCEYDYDEDDEYVFCKKVN